MRADRTSFEVLREHQRWCKPRVGRNGERSRAAAGIFICKLSMSLPMSGPREYQGAEAVKA